MKRNLILYVLFIIAAVLITNSIYAQESTIDYKQLIAKCSKAIKEAKSYQVKIEVKDSLISTSTPQENKTDLELNIVFISPDRFKVTQVITAGSNESVWDGWVVIGNDQYDFLPVFGWKKVDDDNRIATCKNNSPEGIIKQFEIVEKEYKRDSISSVTKDGIEYFVIKYLVDKEPVHIDALPPELRASKINGTDEIWINKNNYLPLKQSSEVSCYSNEQNKWIESTNINYFSYNDVKIKIDKPVLGKNPFE